MGSLRRTYLAWGVNSTGWWARARSKFFMDRRHDVPDHLRHGTEDYFCGSYNFENQKRSRPRCSRRHTQGCTSHQPDGFISRSSRFGMYRWHLAIRSVRVGLRVTIQALGWRSDGRYLPLQDDIASVAYWLSGRAARAVPEAAGPGHAGVK